MSGLDLFERETTERINRLAPMERPETGTWDGFLRGTGMATMRTFAKAGRAIDMAGAVFPIAYDAITGGSALTERYFREHDEIFGPAVDRWTPKAGEVGAAGEIAGQLLGTLPLVIASPALAIGSAQLGTAEDLSQKGVSAGKAQAVGLAQGAGLGLGIYMPIFGRSLWERMLVGGAGFNVVQGAAMRGAGELILKGTPAEGEFKAFDGEALTLDLLLGAGFGAISHVSPRQRAEGAKAWEKMREWGLGLKTEDRDAISVLRQAQHSNVDSLPGKPLAAEDLNAHVDRVKAAVDQLARDERVEVSDLPPARVDPDAKRWTEAERRARQMVKESTALAKAYDIVLAEPLGPINEPVVRLSPEEIGDVIVERGPAWKKGEAEIEVGGYGLVKFLWKHGERSSKAPEFQVKREDVMRAPEVMRDFVPIEDKPGADGERYTEWQVERPDGKKVIYAIRRFTEADNEQHLVTLFVNEEKTAKFKGKALSEKRNRLDPESPVRGSKPLGGDTGPDSFSSPPGGREGGTDVSITEPAGPSASREAGTPPSALGEQARPAASDKPVDPLAAEAERIAAAHPDLQVTVGHDEAGEPIRRSAKDFLQDARQATQAAQEEMKLLQVAAECLLGVG